MLIRGELWKSVDDIIGAYLIVVGVPQAVFSIYNFARHQWWEYYYTHEGAIIGDKPYEFPIPQNAQC